MIHRLILLPLLLTLGSFAGAATEPTTRLSSNEVIQVYKSPTCGCCGLWLDHMRDNDFQLQAHNTDEMALVKQQHGILPRYQSCHTAVSASAYIFEGHVPAKFVQQFLKNPPDSAIGLAVPAMPVGSPGMEMGDRFQPYQVMLLMKDGSASVYATVKTAQEQY
jgi:hypothetical protein